MPKALQAEAILLLPNILLPPSQPCQAAGLLVRCLGYPHPPPPALRLPLLHALNLLDVSGPHAGDVAGMVEQVSPAASFWLPVEPAVYGQRMRKLPGHASMLEF